MYLNLKLMLIHLYKNIKVENFLKIQEISVRTITAFIYFVSEYLIIYFKCIVNSLKIYIFYFMN